MQNCQVCGRSFDPLGFQVVIPELGRGFDRIECAQSARALAGPGSRIAVVPPAAVVEATDVMAVAPAAIAWPLRAPAATLGLLAAGTAAAVVLWLRVLGTDTASYPLIRAVAPPAVAGETVEAQAQTGVVRTAPSVTEPAAPRSQTSLPDVITRPSSDGSATAPPGTPAPGPAPTPPVPTPVPSPEAPSPEVPSPEAPSRPSSRPDSEGERPANDEGKSKDKGGRRYGHIKHGETDGSHSPGHGRSQGSGKGHGKGHGHGKSSGNGKGHGHGKGKSHGQGKGHGKKH